MNCSAPRGFAVLFWSYFYLPALAFGFVSIGSVLALGQATAMSVGRPVPRILGKLDETNRVTLSGNTHPLARRANDRGAVDDGSPMRRMVLTLTHSQDQEAALVALIAQQQDKTSPQFHQWLTPEQYGAQFGIAPTDIQTVTAWLTSKGFTIGEVVAGQNAIEFSGTAGQVKTAFQAEIHKFEVNGKMYQANASDPSIPAALVSVVRGVIQMHNFPHSGNAVSAGKFRRDKASGVVTKLSGPPTAMDYIKAAGGATGTGAKPNFTYTQNGSTNFAIGPYDLATIYNILPLWAAGIDGTGQTIAIIQESNIHIDDVRAFRSLFGLPANDPEVILNGPDPGVLIDDDEGEADIDVQWSGAVAKNATIKLIVSASTEASYGVALSGLYAVNNNVAPVASMSYGECELATGTALNSYYNTLYQQAAAQGISFMVSSGDADSAVCTRSAVATLGVGVNGWGSTPYNTAVGGTDFIGSAINSSSYWSSTNNSTTQASALGYIPETTWNDNCTNPVFWQALDGQTSDAAFCQTIYTDSMTKSSDAAYLEATGGSGGVSNCTVSNGSTVASCSGGWAKPSYQNVLGVPADGKRDVPDVSLMASNGFLGSFYVVCEEDVNTDGQSCNLNSPYADFGGYGGTSISAPAFAGMMALVNQKTKERQGLANYVLYDLFNQQVALGTACSSGYNPSTSSLVTPASVCVFNDLTYGSNAVPCTSGSTDCVVTGGNHYGILTVNGVEAYDNTVGYDLAVGLGSVNAANMVNAWANVTFVPTSTSLALSSTSFAHGTSVNATVTVAPSSGGTGVPTGNVNLLTSTAPASLGYVALSNGSVIGSYNDLPGGSYTVDAYYTGDGTYGASSSSPVSVTVTPENSSLAASVFLQNESSGATSSTTSVAYGAQIFIGMTAAGASGHGTPTGTATIKNGSTTIATVPLNATGEGDLSTTTLVPGSYALSGTYSGDVSFNSSSTTSNYNLTVGLAPTKSTLTRSVSGTVAAGTAVTLTGTVVGSNTAKNGGNYGVAPTGTVSFYSGGTSGTLLGSAPFTSYTTSANVGAYTATGPISSIAALTTASLPYSTTVSLPDSITAVYSGDSNYAGSTSTAGTITVSAGTKTATSSALTATTNPFAFGSSTGVTSTLSFTGSTAPTGTVSFYVDGVQNGAAAALSGTSASSTLTGLIGGAHAVTAIYSGDGNFLGSTGYLPVTVTPVVDAFALTESAATANQGTPLVFTASVPYSSSTVPTGTVTFSVDGVPTGIGTPVESFVTGGRGAVFTTATLSPGSHTISAAYTGDKSYAAANASQTVSVSAVPYLALSVNQPTAIVLGAPVTVNVSTRTLSSGPIPTGSVTYSVDGGATSSAIGLSLGAGSFALSGLNELKHTVLVTYSGDSTYTPASNSIVLNGDVAQTILFRGLANRTFALEPTLSLAARATSGLPVTYAVSGPATLNGSILTITGTGTISVTASQAGNGSFAAAAPVIRSFVAQ